MLFWIIAALMTAGACLAVLAPLSRRSGEGRNPLDHDFAVYKDQLTEIDRDRGRGLIGDLEADEARAEIGRRILAISQAQKSGSGKLMAARPTVARAAAFAAVLSVPLISWGIYAAIGSPGLPGEPLAERLAGDPSSNSLEELVARAEQHLKLNPTDGRGWEVLAPVYMRMSRFAEAETAYRNAIQYDGSNAEREAGHGEAIAALAAGVVTDAAKAAFERAAALDPKGAKARFFLATADAQQGRIDDAAAKWTAMLVDLPEGSPWRGAVDQALGQARLAKGDPEASPGPDAAEVAAAAEMTPDERKAMIEGMVARLDDRLRDNPSDKEGWIRLLRSYMVLGRRDDAQAAFDRAIKALASDQDSLRELSGLASSLGLARTE